MKILMILSIPLILSMSIMLGLSSADLGVFGQQANQTSPQANQTSPQANQTSPQSQGPQMNEKLLNLTNTAISAHNDGNETAVGASLAEIQGTLINASSAEGKPVVIVPSMVVSENADDETTDDEEETE